MKVCDGDEENSMLSLTQDGAPPETVNDPLRVDWPKVMLQPAETITTAHLGEFVFVEGDNI